MKKGMLIKMGDDLFRVLDLQHVTPGNLRGFVRVRFRNIRSGSLSDQKLRSEDTVERAVLDERQMQYLYKDGDSYHFMDTETYEQMHMSAEALGDSVNYIMPEATIAYETGRLETAISDPDYFGAQDEGAYPDDPFERGLGPVTDFHSDRCADLRAEAKRIEDDKTYYRERGEAA